MKSFTTEDTEDTEKMQKRKMQPTPFRFTANSGRRAFDAAYIFDLFFLRVLRVLRGEGVLLSIFLFSGSGSLTAEEARPLADNPVIEARMMKLAAELRCLVCQNQSLADSHAGLALDLKEQVREQVKAGKSDDDIRSYMVARYGDFVLYSPPVKPVTWLLWVGPFALLVGGAAGLARIVRRRRQRVPDADMTPEEQARVRALLESGSGES